MNNNLHSKLLSGFLNSCDLYSEKAALSIEGKAISYHDFSSEIFKLAHCILQAHEAPKRIGILAYRSKVAYSGIMASLFAGCTYVPLNKTFPFERSLAMIKQAELDVIIADDASLDHLENLLPHLDNKTVIILPESNDRSYQYKYHVLLKDNILIYPPTRPTLKKEAEALAYILFTSGSTGQPKGVPITHQNILHFIQFNQARYCITANDRFSQTFDITFDLAGFDMFMAWSHGACLCVMQPIDLLSPSAFVNKENITVWFSVPSVVNLANKMNLLSVGCMPTLRLSLFCGEALTINAVENWQKAAPNAVVENLYGPTELTIACAVYHWQSKTELNEHKNGVVSIGKLYDGLQALIVDETLKPVSKGCSGELCIAGPQQFMGYLHAEDKTKAATFYINNIRYYRTGDEVQLSEQDNLIYLGRIDQQIKVNGYRIELGEIEYHLRKYQNVIDAVAIGWPENAAGYTGIAAFITGDVPNIDPLIQYLRSRLPKYMVPSVIQKLNTMPLNLNGKIDKKALKRDLDSIEEEHIL